MSHIVLYLDTRYGVNGFNTLRDITICIFHVTFNLHLWTSSFLEVICTHLDVFYVVECLYKKRKFVGSVELKYGHLYEENYNDITMTSSLLWFLWNSNTTLPRAYISGIPKFSLIRHKIAEIYTREVNRELWRKTRYWVNVTLTFDPRSPISIGSESIQ